MNLFPHQSLEYSIITHLQQQSWIIVDLIDELRKSKSTLTKQAVYQVIRKLKSSEIVVVTSKRISLSSVWIDRMHEFFTIAKVAYEGVSELGSAESFINLADGDKIVYEFKNPTATDIFWGHAFTLLTNIMKPNEPVLIYNPHQWFLLARPESELRIIHQSETNGHPWFTYVPSKTLLDIHTRDMFTKPSSCYVNDVSYFKPNQYINIFGNFIIEATIDQSIQNRVDNIFETEKIWNNDIEKQLKDIILNMKGRNKLVITHNSKKSAKYRNIFKKYFLLK